MASSLEYNLDISSVSQWNMISPTAMAKTSLIYAQEIGDFWAGKDYFTAREGFASYLIKLTIDGCGQLDYNGQQYDLRPGQFFWIDCQKPQHYRTAPDCDSWHIMWVHFYGGNAKAYYDAFLTHNNGSPVGLYPNQYKALGLFDSLLALEPSHENQMIVDFQAADLLSQLITECVLSTMTMGKTSEMPQIIQGVRMFLQNHYREKHTLEDLGSQFNINPQYLQKQFKRYMGMSPSEYQILLRMTRAKELLRSSKMPIGDIALSVGIDNLGYFTRRFKSQEGMTPQAYRKMWPGPEGVSPDRFPAFSKELINRE